MARRTARPRARKTLTGIERANLRVDFNIGVDYGLHDPDGPGCCEDEVKRLVEKWVIYREDFIEDAPPWAMAVLERGEHPPHEIDERFPHDDPGQYEYLEHQRHLARVARRHYRKGSQ